MFSLKKKPSFSAAKVLFIHKKERFFSPSFHVIKSSIEKLLPFWLHVASFMSSSTNNRQVLSEMKARVLHTLLNFSRASRSSKSSNIDCWMCSMKDDSKITNLLPFRRLFFGDHTRDLNNCRTDVIHPRN